MAKKLLLSGGDDAAFFSRTGAAEAGKVRYMLLRSAHRVSAAQLRNLFLFIFSAQ